MPTQYTIKAGDTMSRIAKNQMGSISFTSVLAQFNGISSTDSLIVGRVIEIPSSRELPNAKPAPGTAVAGAAAVATAPVLARPTGYAQIVATFGDVLANLDADGNLSQAWIQQNIGRARLPYPLRLSWNHSQTVNSFVCHRKLVTLFEQAFQAVLTAGLDSELQFFGGGFNFRQKRTSSKLSAHSWGIAIDLNPETNALGTGGNMDPDVVQIFKSFQFKWGGEFTSTKDPMHFQYCDGY